MENTAPTATVRRASGPAREPESPFTRRTPWPRRLDTPLRTFLRTETGSAAVLLLRPPPRLSGRTSMTLFFLIVGLEA